MILLPVLVHGQDINYDSLLQRIDTVENPVYKPVVSISYGVLNFHGDVKNSLNTPSIGNYAAQIGVSAFVDKKQYFVANFNFMIGKLGGNEYSYSDISRNLNFETSLNSIGLNMEYRFGHLFSSSAPVRPYLSLGLESINFSSKGDLVDKNGTLYHYWSDGSIRDNEEPVSGASMLYRDYVYETDLRTREVNEFGLGDYSQRAFSIPVGAGIHFRIDRRAFFSLGMSYHYALTDVLDNVAYEGTSIKGAKGNDSYIFSHLTFHFDLFSDPATRVVDLLYADAEFDPLLFDDEDGDFIVDVADHCPGTPAGVQVDTLGCPLDGDGDGVPDYLDLEPGSARNAWVNADGVTVSEDEFLQVMQQRDRAMDRGDVAAYFSLIKYEYILGSSVEMPERYKSLDTDEDGYLSFDELLKTIDLFFDFQLDLTLEELRDVNEFFFSQ